MKDITFYLRHGDKVIATVDDVEAERIIEIAEKNLSGSTYAQHSVTFFEPRPADWGDSAEITVRLADVHMFRVYTHAEAPTARARS